ncbi:MAG: hypothetical protein ABMA64_12905 [Myxococcota bacterium]
MWKVWLLSMVAGCGVPQCETLCAARADCVEAEIADYDTTWSDWTGFTDRGSYEAACFAVFDDALAAGAPRGELQKTCRDELAGDVCTGQQDP